MQRRRDLSIGTRNQEERHGVSLFFFNGMTDGQYMGISTKIDFRYSYEKNVFIELEVTF